MRSERILFRLLEGDSLADQDAKSNSNDQTSKEHPSGSTKVEGQSFLDQASAHKTGEPALLTEADLDKEIESADPEFAKSLNTIEIDAADLALDLIDLDHTELINENPRTFKEKLKLARQRIRQMFLATYARLHAKLVLFLSETVPHFFRVLKERLGKVLGSIKDLFASFGKLEKKKKLMVVLAVVLTIGTGVYIKIAVRKNLFAGESQLFIASLEPLADKVFYIEGESQFESFYESIRIAQNIVTTPKLIVNIRPSSQSGENPMAAADLYIEGLGPEVVVEIKDREVEFKDIMQRAIEDMTYDQLETVDGKKLLLEKVRQDLNRNLTQGKIKRVMFKTFIMKP